MLNPNSSQAYEITNARTKSSIIATSPKLTVVYASIPDEALTLTYQGIEYNPDTGEKQIARLNFSLTFDEVEKLANYVKQAKKDYAKQIAAEKKDSIERAKNEVRSAKTHVKWTEKQLTKIKNAS